MTALADEAHELSDRLGDDHDLVGAARVGARHASTPSTARDPMLRGFDVIVESRRGELQEEAFAYGDRLYADKPSVFVGARSRAGGRVGAAGGLIPCLTSAWGRRRQESSSTSASSSSGMAASRTSM